MNKPEKLGVTVVVILVIVISLVAVYDISNNQTQGQVGTNSFIQQPVVDILVPSLFRETSIGGQNVPLNITNGQSDSIVIQVYPTVDLNITMEFQYYLLSTNESSRSSDPGSISATFNPSNLRIDAGKTENTSMTLRVSPSAPLGQYNAVISAFNSANSSQVWGVIVQINVVNGK
ncbi:MAG TPA: hypothetical protein VN739_10920 [Nitrososphaerales archaeon]|nr:hypothetical protein [Nitrososphaerales archaeon]